MIEGADTMTLLIGGVTVLIVMVMFQNKAYDGIGPVVIVGALIWIVWNGSGRGGGGHGFSIMHSS